tara:strand:+ start:291 stop:710 length:420 start_codon:yes stop_codon:yes gene_type:complete
MPSWKKVIVSGSDASLASLSTSGAITGSVIKSIGAISGSEVSASTFYGDGSNLTGLATSADVSGSWGGALSGSLDIISGSAASTGSFGRVEADDYGGNAITIQAMEKAVTITSDGSDTLSLLNINFVTTNSGELIFFEE